MIPATTELQDALLDGGHIERYHVKGQRMLTRQSVAEHSWRMAAIVRAVWPGCSATLLWAVLMHDVSERVTGDLPAPVKWGDPEMSRAVHALSHAEEQRLGIRFELTTEEVQMLGWVDRYEGAVHCLDELEMGNRKIIHTLKRYMGVAREERYRLPDPVRAHRQSHLLNRLAERVYFLTKELDYEPQ